MNRCPSPRTVILSTYTAHHTTKLPRQILILALCEIPELAGTVAPVNAALESLYTDGTLRGDGRRPSDIAELVELVVDLKLSLGIPEPLAA